MHIGFAPRFWTLVGFPSWQGPCALYQQLGTHPGSGMAWQALHTTNSGVVCSLWLRAPLEVSGEGGYRLSASWPLQ